MFVVVTIKVQQKLALFCFLLNVTRNLSMYAQLCVGGCKYLTGDFCSNGFLQCDKLLALTLASKCQTGK